eukprot:2012052-Amphidinium_carterae.2
MWQVEDWWFNTNTAFLREVVLSRFPVDNLQESQAVRACLVYQYYGLVETPHCGKCRGKPRCVLSQYPRSVDEIRWVCPNNTSRRHFDAAVSSKGLHFLYKRSWLPFLHFLVLMKMNMKMALIVTELMDAYGTPNSSVYNWEARYHAAIQAYITRRHVNVIGGKKEVCVMDEARIGKQGQMVGKNAFVKGTLVRREPRIRRRLPAETHWRKGARHGEKKASPQQDARRSGCWLWLGVQCGIRRPRTHGKCSYVHFVPSHVHKNAFFSGEVFMMFIMFIFWGRTPS